MTLISNSQRRDLQEDAQLVGRLLKDIKATVIAYSLPNNYPELTQLLERQKTAISNLLDKGEAGCELTTLSFDRESMIDKPHITNFAYIASEALKLTDIRQREDFVELRELILHEIKNKAAHSKWVTKNIKEIINPPARRI